LLKENNILRELFPEQRVEFYLKNLLKAGYYINMSNKVTPMDTLQIYQRLKKVSGFRPSWPRQIKEHPVP